MKDDDLDNRSPMAIGFEWSARIMAVGLEMVIPAAGGFWLDYHFGTLPVFVFLGAMLGVALGMYHLWRMVLELISKGK
jgi:F0F1-type ATP synthase assembly protein I